MSGWKTDARETCLEKALAYHKMDSDAIDLHALTGLMLKRGMPEQQVRAIYAEIERCLQPPRCEMTHCKRHGGAFTSRGCMDYKIPGQCPILRAYRKRRKQYRQDVIDNPKVGDSLHAPGGTAIITAIDGDTFTYTYGGWTIDTGTRAQWQGSAIQNGCGLSRKGRRV